MKLEKLKAQLADRIYEELMARKSENMVTSEYPAMSAFDDYDPIDVVKLEEYEGDMLKGVTARRPANKRGKAKRGFVRVADRNARRYNSRDTMSLESRKAGKRFNTKTFNMRWIIDALDQVIAELSEKASNEPELDSALQAILASKRLIHAYSNRLLEEPNKSDGGDNVEAYYNDSKMLDNAFSADTDNASLGDEYVKGLLRR